MNTDEDALICDLAETYGIYNYRQLPADRVAVFCYGLRDDSRIKMAMSDMRYTLDTLLSAGILDRLSILIWQKTEDAQTGKNRPASVVDLLTGNAQEPETENISFASGKEFEETRNKILKGVEADGD
ncbi:DUF5361 domain-containing protein [Ligilactobacillus ruminis]|uniref:DUF5361 domain-containing protein n=1 Tax=Ligilactobacillus ruminis TaxID=1623 RepID=UPI003F94762C